MGGGIDGGGPEPAVLYSLQLVWLSQERQVDINLLYV